MLKYFMVVLVWAAIVFPLTWLYMVTLNVEGYVDNFVAGFITGIPAYMAASLTYIFFESRERY